MGVTRLGLALGVLSLCACSASPSDVSVQEVAASAPATASPGPKAAACAESAGDSLGALDLTSVRVVESGEAVTVTYAWEDAVPAGAVLWSLTATGADGQIRQLGYRREGGKARSLFVFDYDHTRQSLPTSAARFTPARLTARFPRSALAGFGAWVWEAVVIVGKDEIDSCWVS